MDSRERPRSIISPKGTMNLMSDKPFWWVVPSVFFVVLAFGACFALIAFSNAMTLLGILAFIIVSLPAEFMFISARTGRACRYEADDEKLTVYRKGKTEEFYYSETLGVSFEPFSMIWGIDTFNCGYKVTIHTKYKDTVRYYAFGGTHGKNPPQETPFWILVMNMPEEKPESASNFITGEEYYANETKEKP